MYISLLVMRMRLSNVVGVSPKTTLLSLLTRNLKTSVEPAQWCFQPLYALGKHKSENVKQKWMSCYHVITSYAL